MADFGIILCSENEENSKETTFNAITHKIKSVVKGRKIEVKVSQVELYKNSTMFVIHLQESFQSLSELKEKRCSEILKAVKDVCIKNNLKYCIMPRLLPEKLVTDTNIKRNFLGQYLFISLMWQIINKLLPLNGRKMEDVEVAVICGELDQKLEVIVELLLSKIKYLTIITENRDLIAEKVNKIYEETGLSIRIAPQGKNVFKDIDVIINLNNFYEFKSSYKLKTNTLIINYSDEAANWISTENMIINNISVTMPDLLRNRIDEGVFRRFNTLELSEMILSHKKDIETEVMNRIYNSENMGILANSINEEGFSIEGFLGRRGFIKNVV